MTHMLAGSQLFSTFPPEALGELAKQAVIKNVPEKQIVFEKGDPGSQMFAILQGRVKISSFSEDGKEVIFAILESGDFFGETSLLDDLPRSATCTAIEDCQMITLERKNFIPFLERNPKLAIHLLSLLSQRLRGADEQMEGITFFPLAARLARKLLALAAEHGDVVGTRIEIAMNISQLELANMICVTRESVNKQLNLWVKDGLISLSQRLIVIEDKKRLKAIGKLD
ncbi:MAG: Crp/Fnr family transcriptional regulator [Betaproteobacteria bacterium]